MQGSTWIERGTVYAAEMGIFEISEANRKAKCLEIKPYNPKLANVFFKISMIEAWGRGFDKIKEACDKYLELLKDKQDLHLV